FFSSVTNELPGRSLEKDEGRWSKDEGRQRTSGDSDSSPPSCTLVPLCRRAWTIRNNDSFLPLLLQLFGGTMARGNARLREQPATEDQGGQRQVRNPLAQAGPQHDVRGPPCPREKQ